MSEQTGEEPTYLDDMVDENPVLFASSETVLTIEDPNLHPMGKATAIFLFFTCMLGFLNGLDYASPDDGLVRPDEFVYRLALTAPDDTATFTGSVVDARGNPMVNATVYLSWLEDATGMWVSEENLTDEAGAFGFEKLDPGLIRVDIIVERDDHRDVFSNRVLLSPPALIEPIGFTAIDFEFPSSEAFAQQPCGGNVSECEIRTIDRTPSQMDHPLMDPSAATGYVLVGFAFMGLALIAA
ncbi:MAG: carboxypeptidase-like regulatory domain-containing protein, partial [Candidatus Thermoplasmatota archaeon]|nr:carboxypeptidase-like regulatory domain-containing protein [Candidatus Thermoplasmatota archaeon]